METAISPSRAVRNPFEREAFVTWRAAGVLTGRTNAGRIPEDLRTRDGFCPSTAMFSGPGFRQGAPPSSSFDTQSTVRSVLVCCPGPESHDVSTGKPHRVRAARSRVHAGTGNRSTAAAGRIEPHIRPGCPLGGTEQTDSPVRHRHALCDPAARVFSENLFGRRSAATPGALRRSAQGAATSRISICEAAVLARSLPEASLERSVDASSTVVPASVAPQEYVLPSITALRSFMPRIHPKQVLKPPSSAIRSIFSTGSSLRPPGLQPPLARFPVARKIRITEPARTASPDPGCPQT